MYVCMCNAIFSENRPNVKYFSSTRRVWRSIYLFRKLCNERRKPLLHCWMFLRYLSPYLLSPNSLFLSFFSLLTPSDKRFLRRKCWSPKHWWFNLNNEFSKGKRVNEQASTSSFVTMVELRQDGIRIFHRLSSQFRRGISLKVLMDFSATVRSSHEAGGVCFLKVRFVVDLSVDV